jgi:pimeloyl-ACP methyl ester carboxylesterase
VKEAQMSATDVAANGSTAVRPFEVAFSDEELGDLRRRMEATRWPERETVADDSQGVRLATMQELVLYWSTEYDFGRLEARLNAFPHFVTEIDGLDIHFIHVKSPNEHALPVIITHGWPGSIVEMLNVIGPLSDPTAHGGDAKDAFDVVVPSMPGYGFSGKPAETGWDPVHIADAWFVLMKRLGYGHFVAQGGDWGAQITDTMGATAPPELMGIHSNMPGTVPAAIAKALSLNVPGPAPRRPGCPPRSNAHTTGSTSSTPRASATHSRWGTGRRPSTGLPIHPPPLPPGCSTTTRTATRTSPAPSGANQSAA